MQPQMITAGGVTISIEHEALTYANAIEPVLQRLDSHLGALFASSFEYPGRYTCWDIGFYNPPLMLTGVGSQVMLQALNQRGVVLLEILLPWFHDNHALTVTLQTQTYVELSVVVSRESFCEEERSRQPSVFSVLRAMLSVLRVEEEPYLGIYGAFGYDLIFQFEQIEAHQARTNAARDMVLYFPDEIYVVNHRKEEAFVRRYEFANAERSTYGLARDGMIVAYQTATSQYTDCDHLPGEYQALVEEAKQRFACGDLFEVVLSQTFYRACDASPSTLFRRMCETNSSPYGFLINLGEHEFLIGASPEMYVRVQGNRVETCPISGTIARGADAIEDAKNIELLLASEKEASELTMCTDVDRNDKSRICKAGSVRVIGRRQIEMYSRLIHTVDHVEGVLRDEFDAVDAFLTHMWVVTVTGAPKVWAMNFIERHEKSARRWYGGAVGWFNLNGDLNTGLVLRTIRLQQGVAEVRAGATLLYDSIPESEERETRLKAAAFLDLLTSSGVPNKIEVHQARSGVGKRVLLIDHQDSFVHTLANYIRQTGAEVMTVRYHAAAAFLEKHAYHLVVLSPGPGRPDDFKLGETIATVLKKKIPLFGVCLGLQGIVEYFGGDLKQLAYPVHGKASLVQVDSTSPLFSGLGDTVTVGRYHSLYADPLTLPNVLKVTAKTQDGIIMGVAHRELPIHAVQFHPETILTMANHTGLRIITNLMEIIHGDS